MNTKTYFFLNGQKYFTESTVTLLSIINYFSYNQSILVLEYNNLICSKEYYDTLFIKNNDKIEIVTIVGGG